MTRLVWDKVGERTYQTGIDRGVLYLADGSSAVWNGLTSIDEKSGIDTKTFYIDGIKYLEYQTPGDFSADLKAWTYPEEFEQCEGVITSGDGMTIHDQIPRPFCLTYRTKMGNDVDGADHGYRIHLLYNLLATPDNKTFDSISDKAAISDFGWSLSGTPISVPGYKPTAHYSFKTSSIDADVLALLENVLYGTTLSAPYLPSMQDILFLLQNQHSILIHDNGDGTWSGIGPDDLVTMDNLTTFTIRGVDALYLDASTYTVQTTD